MKGSDTGGTRGTNGEENIKHSGWKNVQEWGHLKMWAQNENDVFKRIFKNWDRMPWSVFNWLSLERVLGFCWYGNEHSDCMKWGEFRD